ncbi:ArsA-related P-loop ATPase, partial [Streptomyces sp. NPDC007070]|uniref:ArsA-related P-loop ATPase n=1 Tax=Streptomyces sp. NPDC007070 TaxID=3154312 RepID=UPI003401E8AD
MGHTCPVPAGRLTGTRLLWARGALAALALGEGLPGAWALGRPRGFYDAFPLPGHSWVALFPPYNEHLVRDFGAAVLAMAAVIGWAAWSARPGPARAAATALLVFSVPHFAFHLRHLGRADGVEAVAQLLSLVLPVVLAVTAVAPDLTAWRPDAAAGFRADLAAFQDRAANVLDLLGAARLDAEELTPLPGAEELALLRALRDAALSERFDLLVVDLPPAPQALALLALPAELRRYLRRLLPPERQAARALRPVLGRLAGVPMPAEWLYETAARWDVELAAVEAVVADPGTAVRLVAEPGPA